VKDFELQQSNAIEREQRDLYENRIEELLKERQILQNNI
jgi:hypothetical protein